MASSFAHAVLGELHWDEGQTERAVWHWERALTLDPRQVDAALALARARRHQGEAEAGEAMLRALVACDPRGASAWAALAEWLLEAPAGCEEAVRAAQHDRAPKQLSSV